MPARSRRSQTATEEPCGSGQSRDSIEKDKAAQPALLAAAAARATAAAGSPMTARATQGPRRFIFKKPGNNAAAASRRAHKTSPASLLFHRAKYQKGDKINTYTGRIYMRGKPGYFKGGNEIFKTKVGNVMLVPNIKWNDELKLFTGQVHSAEEAIKVREAMKMVSEPDEKELTATGPTDEEIAAVFDFPEVDEVNINIIESFVTDDGEDTKAIGGNTYPWHQPLKALGFKFSRITMMWHGPVGTDTDEVEAKMDEYGFAVEKYADAEVDEQEE